MADAPSERQGDAEQSASQSDEQRARAARLRAEIEALKSGRPPTSKPKTPRDFIHDKMAEKKRPQRRDDDAS